ncbi:MAG: GntR family transcriptional regulator [Pseudomonadota bacterium]
MTVFRRPDPIPIPRPARAPSSRKRNTNLQSRVAKELFQRIFLNRLMPGAVLPNEMTLCEELDVSRTVVREAIKTLEAKHVVIATRKRGTEICPQDQWNALDIDLLTWRAEAGDIALRGQVDDYLMTSLQPVFEGVALKQQASKIAKTVRLNLQTESTRQCAMTLFADLAALEKNPLRRANLHSLAGFRFEMYGATAADLARLDVSAASPDQIRTMCREFLGASANDANNVETTTNQADLVDEEIKTPG